MMTARASKISLSALQGEREGPSAQRWEGEVGVIGKRSGIPHLTPTLSAPRGGKGVGAE
jgi:hypothetical protein